MKKIRIKDICDKGSSSLKQKDVEGKNGLYSVFGASGQISSIDFFHQEKEYIAIVKDGSGIGRVSFMPAKSSVIGTMQYIIPKPGFDIRYVGYCLQSLDLSKYKQGAAIPHIYFKDYGEREVSINTNIKEQQKIVDYLDNAFEKIDQLKKNAEQQLAEAKALFQSSLKSLLEPKEGWEEKKIGDVITHLRTGLNPRVHFKLNTTDAKGYYITVRELKGFTIAPDEKTDRVNDVAIRRINERSSLKIGDVLFSGTGTIGKTALVTEPPETWNIKEGVYAMTPKHSEIDSKWFIYYIGADFFLDKVKAKATGAGVQSIPMKELVKFPVYLPSLSEQQSIVTILDDVRTKAEHLQSNYDKICKECDALKQAILREVFE